MMTLGSLFDGIGGFPLAGVMCGITPVWASEIEPFPLKVTAARFPEMKQLGSVTDINGAEIEPVDIITFGSPCQDLSVAGLQKGIHDGERSNLFFEAVRIIKEMREADERTGRTDEHIRPRFAVWENVPGAFSSNGGEDFKAVLEALAGVMQDGLDIPRPKKWNHAGCVVGNGWSIAWRIYDAQYWGVPQRRKRIYLVADFASERAGEILFERESVSGDSAQGGAPGEGIAADAERSVGRSSLFEPMSLMEENWSEQTVKNALRANASKSGHCIVQDGVKCLNPWDCQSKRQHDVTGCYPTLQAYNGGGGRCDGVCYPAAFMGGQGAKARSIAYCDDGTTPTIRAAESGSNQVPDVCYALQGNGIDRADTAGCNGCEWRTDQMYTLNTIDRPAVAFQASGDRDNPSISVSDRAYCLAANPMSDRGQAVCFQQNQRDEVRNMGEQAGALTAQPGVHNQNYLCYPDVARTLAARHDSSPCVDRGQNVVAIDCRNMVGNDEVSATLQAKNEGGFSLNFVNPICYRNGGYGDMVEGVGTLRANGGDAGGVRKASSLSVYDARGNGDGDTAPTMTGDHENRITDYTTVLVEKHE